MTKGSSSIAQKMNHMVTADNDLSRKSILCAATYQSMRSVDEEEGATERDSYYMPSCRSIDNHNKPVTADHGSRNSQLHRNTLKVPAKGTAGGKSSTSSYTYGGGVRPSAATNMR